MKKIKLNFGNQTRTEGNKNYVMHVDEGRAVNVPIWAVEVTATVLEEERSIGMRIVHIQLSGEAGLTEGEERCKIIQLSDNGKMEVEIPYWAKRLTVLKTKEEERSIGSEGSEDSFSNCPPSSIAHELVGVPYAEVVQAVGTILLMEKRGIISSRTALMVVKDLSGGVS